MSVPPKAPASAAPVLKAAERAAKKEAAGVAKAMDGEPAEKWLPRWYEFRRLFGGTGLLQARGGDVENPGQRQCQRKAEGQRNHQCFAGPAGQLEQAEQRVANLQQQPRADGVSHRHAHDLAPAQLFPGEIHHRAMYRESAAEQTGRPAGAGAAARVSLTNLSRVALYCP